VKRNNESVRTEHMKRRAGKSAYAAKVARGQQMYGPGCCAHKVSHERVQAAIREARRNERVDDEAYRLANHLRTNGAL
jgi:hypothetical protein